MNHFRGSSNYAHTTVSSNTHSFHAPDGPPGLRTNGYNGRDEPPALHRSRDPMAAQLLVASVLGLNEEFEVLTFDEVDELKREQKLLTLRIRFIKQRLVLDSKVRDAAKALHLLISSDLSENVSSPAGGTDELSISERRCEELRLELQSMEGRYKDIRLRLLMHSAGALMLSYDTDRHGAVTIDPYSDDVDTPVAQQAPIISNLNYHSPVNGNGTTYASGTRSVVDDLTAPNQLPNGIHSEMHDSSKEASKKLEEDMSHVLRQLHQVTGSLHRSVNEVDPSVVKGEKPFDPPSYDAEETKASDVVQQHISYIEEGIQRLTSLNTLQSQQLADSRLSIGQRVHHITQVLHSVSKSSGQIELEPKSLPLVPDQKSLDSQMALLDALAQQVLRDRDEIAARLEEHQAKAEDEQAQSQEKEIDLLELWDSLQIAEKEFKIGDAETHELLKEEFSIQALTSKVEGILEHTNYLSDEHANLKQEVEQQRNVYDQSATEYDSLETELGTKTKQLEIASKNITGCYEDLQAKDEQIAKLRSQAVAEADAHRDQLEILQASVGAMKEESNSNAEALAESNHTKGRAEDALKAATAEHESVKAELRHLESEVARLQTELTVARAELDARGGLRTQNTSAASVELLKSELKEALAELETLAKAGIEAEREHQSLEKTTDDLRKRCEDLDTQLAEARISCLDAQSPKSNAAGSVAGDSTSTAMLKGEFKKLMREARAEHLKTLRAEQDERRRLEALVRSIRREQAKKTGNSLSPNSR